jgi:hypothetical protein
MISKLYYNHLAMALLFQPFVSMLIPRAHEIARMSEEKGRRRRTKEEPGRRRPKTTPKGCLYNYMKTRATWPPSQEAHVTPFLHKINYG